MNTDRERLILLRTQSLQLPSPQVRLSPQLATERSLLTLAPFFPT